MHRKPASRLIVLGPPGGGKGTHAGRLSEEIGVPHIATGDILRNEVSENTELGRRAKSFRDSGRLVPDELVTEVTLRRLARPDARDGWILDGFPRTLRQARDLDDDLKDVGVELVLGLEVPDAEVFVRITGRRTCPQGHVYHVDRNPPRAPGVCDVDGLPLEQREDDSEDVIRDRLEIYKRESEPLLDYYARQNLVRRIEGIGEPDEVYERIVAALKEG